MGSTTNRAEIKALFQEVVRAHADHDADAIVKAYAPDAVIFDLSPPLGRGMNRDSVAAWLAGWDGPIQIDARDVNLTVDGDLAFVSALNRMRGRIGGEDQDMWYRTTMCLAENKWAMAHRPRSLFGAVLHGWELSRRGRSKAVVRRVSMKIWSDAPATACPATGCRERTVK